MFSISTSCLDNGLKVLLRRIPEQRTVSCGIWVNQGGKNETVEDNGISHLVEHLMFKIKCKNSLVSMSNSIEDLNRIGSKYNAVTTKDYTGYYIDGLRKDITKILEVLSYIVVNKEPVEVNDLENEKQIILREVEGYLTYSKQIGERVGQALWGEDGFGQIVIGSPDTIKNIDKNMVDSLIQKAYVPENCVLVVVGGFEFGEIEKDINKLFGSWEDKPQNTKDPIIQNGQGIYINDSFGGNRSTIGIGFSTYPCTDKRSKYCEVLKDILVRPGSRLFNELREKRGLVYSLSGFSAAFSLVGDIGFTFTANNDKIQEIIKICMEELKYLKKNGIDEAIIRNVKKVKETEILYSIESTSAQLKTIGASAIRGSLFLLEDELRILDKVNKGNLTKIVDEVISTENLGVAILGNVNVDDIIPILQV